MLYVVWGILGAVVGFMLDQSGPATLAGVLLGLMWARVSRLARALAAVRLELAGMGKGVAGGVAQVVEQPVPVEWPEFGGEGESVSRESVSRGSVSESSASRSSASRSSASRSSASRSSASESSATRSGVNEGVAAGGAGGVLPPAVPMRPEALPPKPQPPLSPFAPSLLSRFFTTIRLWFTQGNVPVKIGMLVLFAGVAALLKYAADEGMLNVPIPVRIALVALAAMAGLVFGWSKRETKRGFALSLQGGAIGVLVITVFAAFRLYGLLPPAAAFALLVILVAGAGVLAVLQDALALAVLGLIAGFAAPVLTSTGHGSHVALFTYYGVLNLAILGIAWKRAWRVLNVLGFVATFGVGAAWGVLQYKPEHFASTEPFLVLNFLFYLVIPWLYLRRASNTSERVLDASLLFGNPLVSLLLQGALLRWQGPALAASAMVAAVIYLGVAYSVRKHRELGLLRDAWAVLAIAFATLAVPLALSASVTSAVFALEGAGLVWLGCRQQRRLARWSGLALQGIAALATVSRLAHLPSELPVFNGAYVGALLVALGGGISCWLYRRYGRESLSAVIVSILLFVWTLFWWMLPTAAEILKFANGRFALADIIVLVAATGWFAAEATARARTGALAAFMAWTVAAFTWLAIPIIAICLFPGWQPLSGWLLAAIVLQGLAHARQSGCLPLFPQVASTHQLGGAWRWWAVAAMAIVVAFDGSRWLGDAWRILATVSVGLLIWMVAVRRPRWITWPLSPADVRTPSWLANGLLVAMTLIFVVLLFNDGDAEPIAYLPIFNPLELTMLGVVAGAMVWYRNAGLSASVARSRPLLLGVAGMALVTSATLRGVHHLGNVPWSADLFASSVAQLSLTVVWSVLGVAAWVWGSKRHHRQLWLAGAITMGVVLAKLLLVDRSHLGNLFGIASFIAYGLLCTVIGYFAPAPPRHIQHEDVADAR